MKNAIELVDAPEGCWTNGKVPRNVRLGPDTSLIIAEQESTMGRSSHPTENLKQGRLSHTRGSGDSNELPRTKDPRHTAEQERTGV